METKRRIIEVIPDSSQWIVLCNDSTVWIKVEKGAPWAKLTDIPQDNYIAPAPPRSLAMPNFSTINRRLSDLEATSLECFNLLIAITKAVDDRLSTHSTGDSK